ncbi:MAG: OmpA family protein [Deltaproteobacteria bacterium]|nr:OmpA family protein [Deltaproteobacteria bacterium]
MRHWIPAISLFVAIASQSAGAQEAGPVPSFDFERLSLDPSATDSLLLAGWRVLPKGDYRFSAAFHYERDPYVLYKNDARAGALIQDRTSLHLMGAVGLLKRFELGIRLPALSVQSGENLTGYGIERAPRYAIGTPWLNGRVAILDSRSTRAPLDLSADLAVGIPIGTSYTFSRESNVLVWPKVSAGRTLGPVALGGEVGVVVRPTTELTNATVTSHFAPGASVGMSDRFKKFRAELAWRGAFAFAGAPFSNELFLAGRFAISAVAKAFVMGSYGFGEMPGTPIARAIAGFELVRAPAEPPAMPRIEPLPKPAAPPVEPPAPPPVPPAEKCVEGEPHEPADCPDLDWDKDGIRNADDACPRKKGTLPYRGCPDSDGDGIADHLDACPTVPGPVINKGCPLVDSDGDGIPDVDDRCPNDKGPTANRGCPLLRPAPAVVVKPSRIELREKVLFAYNRATILPVSFALLDGVAAVLKTNPEIALVRVEGHTDSHGARGYNLTLSAARAKAVRDYLVRAGIEPYRLESRGYGPDKPIDSNKTAAGRENNRRVELTIASRAEETK